MGWTDSHLHRFRIHGKDHGVAHMGGISFADDPSRVRLADFGFRLRERFFYEYDFYDLWRHDIRVEQVPELDPIWGLLSCPLPLKPLAYRRVCLGIIATHSTV